MPSELGVMVCPVTKALGPFIRTFTFQRIGSQTLSRRLFPMLARLHHVQDTRSTSSTPVCLAKCTSAFERIQM